MKYGLFLILSAIYSNISYDIIPLFHFEKKIFHFSSSKTYLVFSYFHDISPSYINSTLSLSVSQMGTIYYNFYLYESETDITQDSKGEFINYSRKQTLTNEENTFSVRQTKGTYYFVLEDPNKTEKETSVMAYSSGIPFEVNNLFLNKFCFMIKN